MSNTNIEIEMIKDTLKELEEGFHSRGVVVTATGLQITYLFYTVKSTGSFCVTVGVNIDSIRLSYSAKGTTEQIKKLTFLDKKVLKDIPLYREVTHKMHLREYSGTLEERVGLLKGAVLELLTEDFRCTLKSVFDLYGRVVDANRNRSN